MNTDLRKYETYRELVDRLRLEMDSLQVFSQILRKDQQLRKLRSEARSELQAIYNSIRESLGIPELPVYLPVRKKITVQGMAFQMGGMPKEIRIYSIKGCRTKPYEAWIPADLECYSRFDIFETFVHEVAHVIEARRFGKMSHESLFVAAYEELEELLKARGFGPLFEPALRLMGVPRDSYAALIRFLGPIQDGR